MSPTIFLSTVTSEFRKLRIRLASLLQRTKRVHVRHQDDFVERGVLTLHKLQEEVEASSVVLHVIGAATGSIPPAAQVEDLLKRLPDFESRFGDVVAQARSGRVTYTQWELWLAAYYGNRLCSYQFPERLNDEQRAHVALMKTHKWYAKEVDDDDALFDEIMLTLVELKLLTQAEARKIIHLPYNSIGTLFKGRGDFLKRLRDSLTQPGSRPSAVTGKALHGLGGVGKTRLAVEYAWQHADDYSALLFVTADSPQNLQRNLAELVGPLVLNLDEQNAMEEEAQVAAALRWLVEHPGWFLILDNVDDEKSAEMVERLLPKLLHGHVVITSRLARWRGQVQPLELDVLSAESAAELLLERTKPEGSRGRRVQASDEDDAKTLAIVLDGLALALEQAGAYIVAKRKSLAQYIELWRKRDEQVQSWHNQREMQYPRSIATTWATTLDQLSEDERTLMNLLAWFDAEPVPLTVLRPSVLTEQLQSQPTWDQDRIESAIASLADYSMVDWQTETVSVHRVVQEVLRSRQSEPKSWLTTTLQLLDKAIPAGSPGDVRTWPKWEPLRSHIQFATAEAEQKEVYVPTGSLMGYLGFLMSAKALHGEAADLKRRALDIDMRAYGPDSTQGALRLNNLAQTLQVTNRLAEAEPLMRRALAIDEQSYGPEHPDVATDLNNLASLLKATNRLTEAEPLMRRALAIDEQTYGAEHPTVGICLNNLAQLLQDTNRLAEAEPLIRRALAIDEQSYGPEHPSVATDLNNLASLLKATNRLAEAEPLMRRALTIDEQSYGPEHPEVARDLNNLALLLQATNRLVEAEPLMRHVVSIFEVAFGDNHPKVATALNNLAQLLDDTNRLAEAEPLMRRALTIDEQSYGPEHPEVARDLNNLASLLQATNRLVEAEPLMRRHLLIFLAFGKATGHQHPHMHAAIANYCSLLEDQGKTELEIDQIIADLLK